MSSKIAAAIGTMACILILTAIVVGVYFYPMVILWVFTILAAVLLAYGIYCVWLDVFENYKDGL
jgi:phosphate/sulfate permease